MYSTSFVLTPPGEFVQGSPLSREQLAAKYGGSAERYQEFPLRRVRIARAFELRSTLVTVGEFRQFVLDSGYQTSADLLGGAYGARLHVWDFTPGLNWESPGFEQRDDHPVACVTWVDACAYCQWLGEREGRVYRLPSEDEWEYACRAGSASEYFWGDSPALGREYLNAADLAGSVSGEPWSSAFPFDAGYRGTSPVASFKPNAWGFYDMLGNVWEWCSDVLPDQGRGKTRVVRGGSWRTPPVRCRCAFSNPDAPDIPFVCHGLRLARDV